MLPILDEEDIKELFRLLTEAGIKPELCDMLIPSYDNAIGENTIKT